MLVNGFNILLFFLSTQVLATSFLPTPIRDQISLSNGIIIGTFENKSYKKNPDGEVVTEAYFKLEGHAGIEKNYLMNPNSFRVLIPGGKWQGIVYHVNGAPKFTKGKKVVLLLKYNRFGFTLANLAMSKFEIVKKGKQSFLVSEIFADYPNIGQIEWIKFKNIVNKHFDGGLIPIGVNKIVVGGELQKYKSFSNSTISTRLEEGRGPASTYRSKKRGLASTSGSESIGIFWLIIILGISGGASVRAIKSKRD